MTDLSTIESNAKAATAGPWQIDGAGTAAIVRQTSSMRIVVVRHRLGADEHHANAAFIASCDPTTILALIAAARRAGEMETALRNAIAAGEEIGPTPTHDTYGDRRRLTIGVVKMLNILRDALPPPPALAPPSTPGAKI